MRKVLLYIAFLTGSYGIFGQATTQDLSTGEQIPIVDFDGLKTYLEQQDEELLIVNFWATWCVPCVEELPYFEQANEAFSGQDVKIILVSLDFKSAIERQLIPFIEKNQLKTEVIVLSDANANVWINAVSEKWTGAIPATWYIKKGEVEDFHEGKYPDYQTLKNKINSFQKS